MRCNFPNLRNLFGRRCRRHPARRLIYGQLIESMEPRLVLSAVVATSPDGGGESSQSGDDEAEDSIIVDYGAVGIEYSRGQDVLISSCQSSGSAGGDSIPQNEPLIGFNFRIEVAGSVEVTRQDSDALAHHATGEPEF